MLRALAIAACLATGTARAEDEFGFVAPQFGFNAPLGLIGCEAGVGLAWFRGAAGAGIGATGLELAAMARAMTTVSGFDLGVGLGVSRGPGVAVLDVGRPEPGTPKDPLFASGTYWMNTELVVEVPVATWAATRFFAGVSYAVVSRCDARDGDVCDGVQRAILEDHRWSPYVGVAAVVRFPDGPARQTFTLPRAPLTLPGS